MEAGRRTAKKGKKGDGGGADQEEGQHSTAAFSSSHGKPPPLETRPPIFLPKCGVDFAARIAVLGKVKDFLGAIAEANEKLQQAAQVRLPPQVNELTSAVNPPSLTP